MKKTALIVTASFSLLALPLARTSAAANSDLRIEPACTEIGGLAASSSGGGLTLQSGFTPMALSWRSFAGSQVKATPINASSSVNNIRVYPNPWRVGKSPTSVITFDRFTTNTTVKIFTVSGHWVKTLPTSTISATWDRTNNRGELVASGLYIYLITTDIGAKKTGQLAIIR